MSDPLGVLGLVLADKYRVDRLVGEGGFGVVYAGTHLVLGLPIAIKLIKIDPTASASGREAEAFVREARILFGLSHPNIVRMYDVGQIDLPGGRTPWFALELLSGPTLDREIAERRAQRRPMSAAELAQLFDPLLDGLAHAHTRGIVHRDLKPSNVALARADSGKLEPKLLDFGTARADFQTVAGTTGFTPLYAAPEQWDRAVGPTSPATDVFSMGLTILEACTLERPHGRADTLGEILRAVMDPTSRARLAHARPDLPPALDAVLLRATAVRPEDRFPNAAALRQAFDAALGVGGSAGPPIPNGIPQGVHVPAPPPAPYAASGAPPTWTGPTPTVPAPRADGAGFGVAAFVLAGLALLFVLAGLGIGGALYLSRSGPLSTSPAPSAAPPRSAAPAVSAPPLTGERHVTFLRIAQSQYDQAPLLRAVSSRGDDVERCYRATRPFTGSVHVTITTELDGGFESASCSVVANGRNLQTEDKHPGAIAFCNCVQEKSAEWVYPPVKKKNGFIRTGNFIVSYDAAETPR